MLSATAREPMSEWTHCSNTPEPDFRRSGSHLARDLLPVGTQKSHQRSAAVQGTPSLDSSRLHKLDGLRLSVVVQQSPFHIHRSKDRLRRAWPRDEDLPG